jgi:hypothetical protein
MSDLNRKFQCFRSQNNTIPMGGRGLNFASNESRAGASRGRIVHPDRGSKAKAPLGNRAPSGARLHASSLRSIHNRKR